MRPILASRTLGHSDLPILAMRGLRDTWMMLCWSYGGLTGGQTRCFIAYVSDAQNMEWTDHAFASESRPDDAESSYWILGDDFKKPYKLLLIWSFPTSSKQHLIT